MLDDLLTYFLSIVIFLFVSFS